MSSAVRRGLALLGAAAAAVAVAVACSSGRAAHTTADVTRPTTTHGTSTSSNPVPEPIFSGRRDLPLVALTFDSNLTDFMIRELEAHKVASFDNVAVIDDLDRLHVPATFFLAGKWMEQYPDTARRLANDPLFELGSHSYAHLAFTSKCYGLGVLAPSEMAADVIHSEDVLHRFTDHPTRLFRFPGGCYDHDALVNIAPAGVTVIQYDVASGDAFGVSVPAIVNQVMKLVHNGSIIVMHVTGGNTAPLTDKALPQVVTGLRGRGFTLVRVSDLLAGRPGE